MCIGHTTDVNLRRPQLFKKFIARFIQWIMQLVSELLILLDSDLSGG